jgi:hypothetical protein
MATRTTTKKVVAQELTRVVQATGQTERVAFGDAVQPEWDRLCKAEAKSELAAGDKYAWDLEHKDGTRETKTSFTATTRTQKAERALERFLEARDKAEAEFKEAKARFATDFETNPASAIEWASERVVKAQAAVILWTKADRQRGELSAHGADATAVCEGMSKYLRELREQTIANLLGCREWEHRSTSQWSNAVREATASAQADLVRDSWNGLHRAEQYMRMALGETL